MKCKSSARGALSALALSFPSSVWSRYIEDLGHEVGAELGTLLLVMLIGGVGIVRERWKKDPEDGFQAAAELLGVVGLVILFPVLGGVLALVFGLFVLWQLIKGRL